MKKLEEFAHSKFIMYIFLLFDRIEDY